MRLLRTILLGTTCALLTSSVVCAADGVQLVASEPIVLQHPHINKSIGNPVYCLAFVNEGAQLATGAASGVLIWDVRSGSFLQTLDVDNRGADTLVVDPLGKSLVAGGASGTIKVWDARTLNPLETLGPTPGAVQGLAISPDGKLLASISPNGQSGVADSQPGIILWDLARGQQIRTIPHPRPSFGATLLAFLPDGRQLLSAQDRAFRVVDVRSGEITKVIGLPGLPRTVGALALDASGERLVTGVFEPRLRIWTAQSFKELLAWNAHDQQSPPKRGVSAVGFSRDGKYVFSGGMDGMVCVWEASSGRRLLELDGRGEDSGRWVTGVTLTPDNRLLAASHFGGSASIWSITEKK